MMQTGTIEGKPIIAITMGDPAGVGPEVTVKALAEQGIHRICRPLVVGAAGVLARANEMLGNPVVVRPATRVADGPSRRGRMDVLDLANVELARLDLGKVSAMAGRAAVEYVVKAVELAQAGEVAAIVTGPINKEAINLAGYHYVGHTEILADLTHTARCTTMLAAGPLRVTHVTRHVPLREVGALITQARVLETIVVSAAGLHQFGVEHPRLGVAALNPHGGEGGLLGREEMEEIKPAVEEARRMGIDAQGPYPADSIFFRAIAGEFDAVVAMYHDQGHIPIKVHDFEGSFTVTLGLPIVRTSVDHGTAFDIAWTGVSSSRSMIEAIRWAAEIAVRRGKETTKLQTPNPNQEA
jgi:4-hydroxythreonine-4-phosphate dehydrogenase